MIRYEAAPDACPEVTAVITRDVKRLNRRHTIWHRVTVHITAASAYRLPSGALAYCAWPVPAGEAHKASSVELYVASGALSVYAFCGCTPENGLRWLRDAFLREYLAYQCWGTPRTGVEPWQRRQAPSWAAVGELRTQLDREEYTRAPKPDTGYQPTIYGWMR